MAANSKHYLDVYVWLKKVIYSCNTVIQLTNTKKMIRQYEILYKEYDYCKELKYIADGRINFLLKD